MADKLKDNFENSLFGIDSDESSSKEFELYQEAVVSQEKEQIKEAAHAVVSAASVRADERLNSGHFNDRDKLEKYIEYVKSTRDPELMLILPELEDKLREMENMTDIVVARNNSEDEKEVEFGFQAIDNFMSESNEQANYFTKEEIEELMLLQQKVQSVFEDIVKRGVIQIKSMFEGEESEEQNIYVIDPKSQQDLDDIERLNEMTAQILKKVGCEMKSNFIKDEEGRIVANEISYTLPQSFNGNIDLYNLSQEAIFRIVEARNEDPFSSRTHMVTMVYDGPQKVAVAHEIDDVTAQDLPQAEVEVISQDLAEAEVLTSELIDLSEVELETISQELPEAQIISQLPEVELEVISQELTEAEIEDLPVAQAISCELAASLPQAQVEAILEAQNEVREALLHHKSQNLSQDQDNHNLPTRIQESDNVKG